VDEVAGEKRRLKRGERGPGKKDYTTVKSANQSITQLTERINELLENLLFAYTPTKRNLIVDAAILNLRKNYGRHENKEVNNEINSTLVKSLKEYLNGLKNFGGKFAQVESTIENVISSI
jgi:phosphoglycolate phosphatase-like HAD superfamily hydrolase